MRIDIHIVNAFTQQGQGGNPAAVVLDAERFTAQQKQAIAAATRLSETAFVSPSTIADVKLEFFTPTRQIAHCGHATVAAFAYLLQLGRIGRAIQQAGKETIDGTRTIRLQDGQVFMEQQAPKFTYPTEVDALLILQSLGLPAQHIHTPVLVSTGNRFMVLQVEGVATLAGLRPDLVAIRSLSEQYDLIGYYVFTTEAAPGLDATARMFAPAYGIAEESATGMAAGPLAAYLHRFSHSKSHYSIEQGRFMQPASASLIQVDLQLEADRIVSLYAGGEARMVEKRKVVLDGSQDC